MSKVHVCGPEGGGVIVIEMLLAIIMVGVVVACLAWILWSIVVIEKAMEEDDD